MSILARYALATSLILLVTFVLFAMVTLSSIRHIYDHEAVILAEMISETIISTTHHGMLNNDSQSVYQMIAEVGRQPEIDHVRLLNKDGVIRYSTQFQEIGNKIDKNDESCAVCHHGNFTAVDAPSMNRSRRYTDAQGMPVLGLTKGIYNKPVCSSAACHVHSTADKLVGVLDVTIPLSRRDSQVAIFKSNFVIFASGIMVFLFFSLVVVTHKYVKEPIQQLIRYTQKVSQGDFSAGKLQVASNEMQELGNAFEVTTHSLHKARLQLQEANVTLEERVAERSEEIRLIQTQLHHSERLASIGEMAAGIAHEINNPLTSVMIFTSLLLKRPDLEAAVKSDLETILGETGRCADIVSRLLEFSRATTPHKGMYQIEKIVAASLQLLECQALFHNVTVVRDFAPGLPAVACDQDQLKQVFMNIFLNATQAMRLGGVLTIGIKTDPTASSLGVTINDTGGGIPQENLSRIFDPFFTTKGASGTGLGLSVSFGIIVNHGGRIEVKNRPGAGATFVIWLPLAITATG